MSGEYPKRALRIMAELEKQGIDYDFAYNDTISVTLSSQRAEAKINGKDVRDYTHIIFGGHHLHSQKDYELKRLVVEVIDRHNANNPTPIKVQNARFVKNMPFYSKLYMAKLCLDHGLPFLATFYDKSGNYKRADNPIPYPLIVKHIDGRNEVVTIDGKRKIKKNVFKVDNLEGWNQERLASKDLSKYFIQEFTDAGEDFRFFVVKGEVIGGWKRVAGNSFMTVNRNDGSTYFYENNPEQRVKDICKKAADSWGVDFMALDFIYKDGEPHILEFSMHPGLNAYESKCEGGEPANIAEAIIHAF